MKIRLAELEDIDKIVKLGNNVDEFKVSEKVVSFWPKKVIESCINSKNEIIIISEVEEQIIGFLIVNYNPTFSKAVFENVFVIEEFRNKGIAKKMLDLATKKLKENNCKYICSLVDINDNQGIGFYLKSGFNKGIDCVWLDKILDDDFKE